MVAQVGGTFNASTSIIDPDDLEIVEQGNIKPFMGDEGTIHFWTRSEDWHSSNLINFHNNDGRETILIRKATQAGTTDDYLSFIIYPEGRGYSAWSVETDQWKDNEWVHVAIVWQKDEVVDIYLNGIAFTNYITQAHATNTIDDGELERLQEIGTLLLNGRKLPDGANAQVVQVTFEQKALSTTDISEIVSQGL